MWDEFVNQGVSQSRVSATRRNVVRGAAWSVPVIAVAATAPAYAASTCASPRLYSLDWGSTSYTHTGNTSYARVPSSPTGSADIYVHFSAVFQGNGRGDGNVPGSSPTETRNLSVPPGTGNASLQDPVITNLGGLGAGERGVRLQQISPRGYDNRQDVTVSFRTTSSPTSSLVNVQGLSFYIVDIDNYPSPYAYSDRVALSSTQAYNQGRDTTISGSGTTTDPWYNTDGGNQDENASGARVRISFPDDNASRISTFTLTYWTNTSASATNTGQYHRIYMSDFSLKTCP